MKEEFLKLLRTVNREGMEDLIEFLEKSDFFKAPASTRFHGNFEGGLVEHSLKVYEILKHKVENNIKGVTIPEESIIIIGLLHDICKTNFYKIDYRNAKNALGVWEKVPYYTIEDTIPYGHGEKSDFFKAPASTRFHGDHEGGLVEHSLKVYEILKHKVEHNIKGVTVPEESIIIIGLLHDICKTNFYKVDYRNAKNALGVWEKVPYYTIEDTIPYGHGEKSVMMITEYMKLTPEEKYAIRWHMGYTEPKELYNAIGASYTKYPIALLTHEADLEATYLMGR